jgi:hypothetical protein
MVKEQTKKKSHIKRWVHLLLRCLAFLFLVFAFAQPYFPAEANGKKSGNTIVAIYLDNSFSMQGKNETGSLFEQAKQQAIELIKSFDTGTTFIFSTNQFEPKHSKSCDAKQAIQFVQQTKIGGQRKNINAIQAKHQSLLPKKQGQIFYFYLSDFQENQFTTNQLSSDSIAEYILLQFSHVIDQNISVDSVWTTKPSMLAQSKQEIHVRIKNEGSRAIENYPLEVSINDQSKQRLLVNVSANSFTDIVTSFLLPKQNVCNGKISIEDYPIIFDNTLLFTLNVQKNINIHALYERESESLLKLFKSDSLFDYTQSRFSNINLTQIENAEVLLLLAPKLLSEGIIRKINEWVKGGKTVIFIPENNVDLISENKLFAILGVSSWKNKIVSDATVNKWELDHPIFENVLERKPEQLNYPKVKSYFEVSSNNENIASISGKPIIERFQVGLGDFYRVNTSVNSDNGNLGNHALFLTALFRMGEMTGQTNQLYYNLGSKETIAVNYVIKKDEVLRLSSNKQEYIPYQIPRGNKTFVSIPNEIEEANYYTLNTNTTMLETWALNYDRKESSLRFWSVENLSKNLQLLGLNVQNMIYQSDKTTKQLSSLTNNSVLWQYCLWFMLLFLMLEILINKRW